jgi:hypothetical protein
VSVTAAQNPTSANVLVMATVNTVNHCLHPYLRFYLNREGKRKEAEEAV